MHHRLAPLVLLACLLAVPAAQAKTPKTATFKVVYDGHGAFSRASTLSVPCQNSTANVSTVFDWEVTFPKVTVFLKESKAPDIAKAPKGKLTLTSDYETKYEALCGGEVPDNCSKTDVKSTGNLRRFGYLRMGKDGKKLRIQPDADASPSGAGDICPGYGDSTQNPFMYLDNYGPSRDDGFPSPLMAMNQTIPLKEALENGKHVLFVKNVAANLPGDDFPCSTAGGYDTCTESQGWEGHITLTRLG